MNNNCPEPPCGSFRSGLSDNASVGPLDGVPADDLAERITELGGLSGELPVLEQITLGSLQTPVFGDN